MMCSLRGDSVVKDCVIIDVGIFVLEEVSCAEDTVVNVVDVMATGVVVDVIACAVVAVEVLSVVETSVVVVNVIL